MRKRRSTGATGQLRWRGLEAESRGFDLTFRELNALRALPHQQERSAAEQFLGRLADPARPRLERAAIVVAHPDDETIGCGAQLRRFAEGRIVLVTDGAPQNLRDAHARGLDSAAAYAATRHQELVTALEEAGVPEAALVRFDVPDQQAALQLADLARRLADLFAITDTRTVLTHAYEGGHPDHDATAFAVHAAAALGGRPEERVVVMEMPYYRLGRSGRQIQSFVADPDCPETTVSLTDDERALKQRMMAAHASQKTVLAPFPIRVERFRHAPHYDFTAPPNGGLLYYAGFDWGMTGERWCELARAACRELGLDGLLGRAGRLRSGGGSGARRHATLNRHHPPPGRRGAPPR
jgi:LmbE family N-acetylglucosaminyl deacetylase